jgi:hypothetical protein
MKRNVVSGSLGAAFLGAFSLVACGGGGGDDTPKPPDTGTYYHYVTNSVKVPSTATEATKYGLNVDDDPDDETDNALGRILATLKGQGVDIQTQVTDAIASGDLILLHSVRADDLVTDKSASWQVYLGAATQNPDYSGAGSFTLGATSPKDALLVGELNGGLFTGGPGKVTIQLAFSGGAPVDIELIGTKVEASATADGCTDGVLAGAITEEKLNAQVLPAIATLLNDSIADDGGTACSMANMTCPMSPMNETQTCDTKRNLCVTSTSKTVLNLFDDDLDKMITASEIMNDSLIKALLEPDVDLLDANKAFKADRADRDGKEDSLSLGLGFTCVKGNFTASNEQ